jgi:hypothetical protein
MVWYGMVWYVGSSSSERLLPQWSSLASSRSGPGRGRSWVPCHPELGFGGPPELFPVASTRGLQHGRSVARGDGIVQLSYVLPLGGPYVSSECH